jgi:hypothetical protein
MRGACRRHPLYRKGVEQCLTDDIFHDDEHAEVVVSNLKDLADERVIERGCSQRVATEPLACRRVVGEMSSLIATSRPRREWCARYTSPTADTDLRGDFMGTEGCIRHTSAIVVLWAAAATVVPATARADDVTDWNRAMLRAGLIAGTSNLAMTRVAAMVEVAVFDAVNGIERRYTPVHVTPSVPPALQNGPRRLKPPMSTVSWEYRQRGLTPKTSRT